MYVVDMRPIVTDVAWSIGLSVIVSAAQTAEPIEMPFGLWTWVGHCVLDGGPDRSCEAVILRGKGRTIVKYRECRLCAAATRPFVELL